MWKLAIVSRHRVWLVSGGQRCRLAMRYSCLPDRDLPEHADNAPWAYATASGL